MHLFSDRKFKYFSCNNCKKIFESSFIIFLFCIFSPVFLTSCSSSFVKDSPVTGNGFYFDTVVSITLYEGGSEELLEQCMGLAEYYENLLSPNVEGSDVWKLNHSMGQAVAVDEDTLELLEIALRYARLSDGLVDPSIGSLSQLWNFGSDNQAIVPSKQQIEEALSHVDYHSIIINGNQVTLNDPMAQAELGFIAKGYIGDKLKEYLLSKGVTSALINLGGNVVAVGNKPDGTPFRVGIQQPFAPSGTPALSLDISDMSVVSSGNYERFFEKDGEFYHHILSTDNGYPAQSGLSQVTILSPDSVDGDALSTLCFILGYEKALSLLESFPEIQAVFITKEGDILYVNF
ncbi:FAD:protein FMN transferase [Parablautia muri]|uniref:FAD:protein FMN transferase n=1 Tax=Parablautia muri TaxID=2320879 RepID=A0A9X5GR48_9FIRM|nr:FAD:protein FMN transferase [Parablautia muri]NBJ91959.1 FAD:protein FMN transferase [Parablautia muri]